MTVVPMMHSSSDSGSCPGLHTGIQVYGHTKADTLPISSCTNLFQSLKDLPSAKSCQTEPWKLIIVTVNDNLHSYSTVMSCHNAKLDSVLTLEWAMTAHRPSPTAHLPNTSMKV